MRGAAFNMRILWAWVVEILKSSNEHRSRELRTARRRVKRNSIVINNPDRRPRLDRGLSRASCKANTIYHPFKREARNGESMFSEVSTWRMACARWKQKSVRYGSRTTQKTRFKLTSRYFSPICISMRLLKIALSHASFLAEKQRLSFNIASFYVIFSRMYWINNCNCVLNSYWNEKERDRYFNFYI